MQYREIVAVTGLGGLYHLLATKSDGAIVRALADDSTRFIPSRLHSVTPLESIEIYTVSDNVRLHEVLQKMKDSDAPRPDPKASTTDIRGYFSAIFPEIDEERVYTSDMKKMLKWFDILQSADLLDFSAMTSAPDEDTAPEDAAAMPAEGDAQVAEHEKESSDTTIPLVEEGEADTKPAKKARAKKAATSGDGEEAAPKKTTAKKSAKPEQEEGGE